MTEEDFLPDFVTLCPYKVFVTVKERAAGAYLGGSVFYGWYCTLRS